ncbi:BH3-interacting domain death agonist-like [Syngnathus typhle]|uniref:BH3-interacting domain death agonist-like n=1 Tax=Syngnathus typhle TaxID=161592 RepID=UPI002A6B7979|nr:BH3-interacting domain death agonist-like [Syngnathus typhle]XP_061140311.1 BH3-interacting domain death agonist-like [Syngnathus typhle]
MDDLTKLASEQNAALVVLSFLQADCSDVQYNKAVCSLGNELTKTWRSSCEEDDGVIESDGYLPISNADLIAGMEPGVEHYWPGGDGEARDLQEIAARLREIAAQFQQNVVDQAAQNLRRNILSSPSEQWLDLLKSEVQRAMMMVGLEQLPQERVILALSLTLMKQVCVHSPQLLRDLFNTALRYVTLPRPR